MATRPNSYPPSPTSTRSGDTASSLLSAPKLGTVSLPNSPQVPYRSLNSNQPFGLLTPPGSGSTSNTSNPLSQLLTRPSYAYDLRQPPQYPVLPTSLLVELQRPATSNGATALFVQLPSPIPGVNEAPLIINTRTPGVPLSCIDVLNAIWVALRDSNYAQYYDGLPSQSRELVKASYESRLLLTTAGSADRERRRGIRRSDFYGSCIQFAGISPQTGGWYRLNLSALSY